MKREVAVLLVEDDQVDVMNVKRAFKKGRISNPLFVAGDGLEALAMLRAEGRVPLHPQPKVVLLDLNMPRMNGLEFLSAIREDPQLKSLSVFVLTTSDDERDIVAAYKQNVAGYILKPVEPDVFFRSIATLNIYWSMIEMP